MFHELMRHLVLWIYQHPNWAGLALGLISAGESMTVIGSFIPGTIVMTAVGIFIGADLLAYWPMVFWAAAGAFLGDALNFSLGYYLKDNIRTLWPFNKRQHWLMRGQSFLEKHGGKSIFFARFIGPLRAFAPVIAGALRMSPSKFYAIDALSACIWAVVYLLPGVLLGAASLELAPDITEHLFRRVFFGLVILIISLWVLRFILVHVREVMQRVLARLWLALKTTSSWYWFCYLFRHYRKDHPRGQLGALLIFLCGLLAFAALTYSVEHGAGWLMARNMAVYHFTQTLRTSPALDHSALTVTLLGEKPVLAVMCLVIFAWLCYRRCWRALFSWSMALALGIISTYALKHVLHIARPSAWFEHIDGPAYPSGHVAMVTLLYGGLAYFCSRSLARKWRGLAYLLAIALIALVAASRLFLGVHWVSDIVGSMLLGWLCLLAMTIFYQRYPQQPTHLFKLLPYLVALQVLLVVVDGHYQRAYLQQKYFPPLAYAAQRVQTLAWLPSNTTWERMATDRFGHPQRPITVQWQDTPQAIHAALTAQGWRSATEPRNWVLEMQHPEVVSITVRPPITTYFFADTKPALTFSRPLDNAGTIVVLQLWPIATSLLPPNPSLFVGCLSSSTNAKKKAAAPAEATLTAALLAHLAHSAVTYRVITSEKIPALPMILIQGDKKALQ